MKKVKRITGLCLLVLGVLPLLKIFAWALSIVPDYGADRGAVGFVLACACLAAGAAMSGLFE